LYFSVWDKATWSTPTLIENSLPTVVSSSLAMHGSEALLIYVLDMDSKSKANEGYEIFARIFSGGKWGEAIRLTSNQIADISPKVVYTDGSWLMTWLEDGKLVYKKGLNGEALTQDNLIVSSEYKLVAGSETGLQAAIVFRTFDKDGNQSLSTCTYDATNNLWGGYVILGDEEGHTSSFDPIFMDDGTIKVAYTSSAVITEVVDGNEQNNVSDKTDLRIITFAPSHDLALDSEDGLTLYPEIPIPRTTQTALVTVQNNGDFTENAVVTLYEGNPEDNGVKVAEKKVDKIPARTKAYLEMEWVMAEEVKEEYSLYAVVRFENGAEETRNDNNTLSTKIMTSDIEISEVTSQNIIDNDYLVFATVTNRGSKILENLTVRLEHANGQVLQTAQIEKLDVGRSAKLQFVIDTFGLETDKNGKISLAVRALVEESISEYNTENNIKEFAISPSFIEVVTTTPGVYEKHVEVLPKLTIGFNMKVYKGAGFENIILKDDELNEISIEKSIEGDTLTVTPTKPLNKDTSYELIIPANAFGDSYGHLLSKPFKLKFSTTSSSAEIIHAYPNALMEDVPTDSEISLKFNQRILQGISFSDIMLYQTGSYEVTATKTIKGEWLYIKPQSRLQKNMEYSLIVPKGAVQNGNLEALREDYVLTFTTSSKDSSKGRSTSAATLQTGYNISRQISDDGKSIAIVTINEQYADQAYGKPKLKIDLSEELKQDKVIRINIAYSVLKKLAECKAGLDIETGKGSISFSAKFIESAIKSKIDFLKVELDLSGKPLIKILTEVDGAQTEMKIEIGSFTASLPYTPSEAELKSTESIIVSHSDLSGSMVVTNGNYNIFDKGVIFSQSRSGIYTVGFHQVKFEDVKDFAWYNSAVSFIAARNITKGTDDRNFSPEKSLSRGEFLVLAMRAFGINDDENPKDNFEDAGNTYYTGYLSAAKRLGIAKGIGENLFAPDNNITRQEMFVMIYHVLKHTNMLPQENFGKSIADFADFEKVDPWAVEATSSLVKAGIIKGKEGMLAPKDLTTRAEMAQVLYGLLSKSVNNQ